MRHRIPVVFFSVYILSTLFLFACNDGANTPGVGRGPFNPILLVPNPTELAVSPQLKPFETDTQFNQYLSGIQQNLRSEGGTVSALADGFASDDATAEAQTTSITNNQETGVDEGDIVKVYQDYFVVLRQGRLFTVSMAEGLTSVDTIPSYAPGSQLGVWYDEMLIYDNTIVVLGYSYRVGATEIGLFSINDAGELAHLDTYFLRSHDYYSSRNYASRLIDNELIFYMPYALHYFSQEGTDAYLPAITNIADITVPSNQTSPVYIDDWLTIIDSSQIYRPVKDVAYPALHSIVRCDLSQARFSCSAQGIIAPFSRNFYVSRDAVYLWTTHNGYRLNTNEIESTSVLYRLSLEDDSVKMIEAHGSPIDQFSFKDDGENLHLLLQQYSGGDWMWQPEYSAGDLRYLTIPLNDFGDQLAVVNDEYYTTLNNPGYGVVNRFVGENLLYGTHSSSTLNVFNYQERNSTVQLSLDGNVERIDYLGGGAIVVGQSESWDDLNIYTVSFDNGVDIVDRFTVEDAYQGESRSHGYQFTQTPEGSVFGLPLIVYRPYVDPLLDEPASSSIEGTVDGAVNGTSLELEDAFFLPSTAEIIYFHADDNLSLTRLGSLQSADTSWYSNCEVSCVDWYGNTRPIFYDDRIFGLMGYEIVEAEIQDQQLNTLYRSVFSPDSAR